MAKSTIGRRTFMKTAAVAAAASRVTSAAPADAPDAVLGEPFDLLGNRLYFTNWYYVRPGSFGWFDDEGNRVPINKPYPPDGAHLRRMDMAWGVRIVAQPAQRMGPLMRSDKPWEEGAGVSLMTVFKDGGVYRGWHAPFTISGDPPGQKYTCYLESQDGMNWTRPNVGIVEYNGSKANNIVNILGIDGATFFKDPSAPAAERYKMIAEGAYPKEVVEAYRRRRPRDWDPKLRVRDGGSVTGMKGAVSPDGLHWTMFAEPPVMEVTDTQLTAYYDVRLQKYVAFTRTWPIGARSTRVKEGGRSDFGGARRSIGRSETSNFREFPIHETILEPGPDLLPTDTLYTNCKTTMPGAPDHHMLFPMIWHTASDATSIAIASSHDSKLWHFLPGSPVFTTGPFGGFDGGCVFSHPNLIELPNGDFALPYTGYNVPHKYPRMLYKFLPGYMVWPKGRLIALEAPERGEFATLGLVPPGRKLRINALTRRGGSILVEAAGMDGKPLAGRTFDDCRRLIGDLHWAAVSWKGQDDLGFADNTGMFLRFRLDQAQIFGLEFA